MAIKFDQLLRTLIEDNAPLTRATVRRLSNLGEAEQKSLMQSWGKIPVARRQAVLQEVSDMAEDEFDTDFSALTRLALTDLNDNLREAAIETAYLDESAEMLNRLLPLASVDPSPTVRAAAVSALGRYILQAELGKFSQSWARLAQRVALKLYHNQQEDIRVRCRALEAISNSSRSEVTTLIRDAYQSDDARLRASAIYAMGRTCDEQWTRIVMTELESDDPTIRYEAVRAAGELELDEAVPHIGRLLRDADRQTLEVGIWALGEIGGGESQRILNSLFEVAEDHDDEKLIEILEDAISNASLAGNALFDV